MGDDLVDVLSRVLYCMVSIQTFYTDNAINFANWKRISSNVCVGYLNEGKNTRKVFKLFDFRNPRAKNLGRSPQGYELMQEHYAGYQRLPICPNFDVVVYDFFKGSHYPTKVYHLYLIAKQIQSLHSKGKVHGDIRLANFLFGEKNTGELDALLIDLDFVGDSFYPFCLHTGLRDTKRHPEVVKKVRFGNLRKTMEHDWFSFSFVCSLFSAKDVGDNLVWSSLFDDLRVGLNVDRMESIIDLEIEISDEL